MQILPTPALAQIVKHFLIIENDYTANLQHSMFSDGDDISLTNLLAANFLQIAEK